MISRRNKKSDISVKNLYMKRPTFLDGLASNYDLYNAKTINPHSSTFYDIISIKSDFDMVGNDLYNAMKKFRKDLTI